MQIIKLDITYADILAEMHPVIFPYQIWKAKDFIELFKQTVTRGLMILKEEMPLGYLVWHQIGVEVDIITIGILPSHRELGIAQKLYDAFEDDLRQQHITRITLDVAENNKAAISFYQKQGFRFNGSRPGYYKIGRNAVDALLGEKAFG